MEHKNGQGSIKNGRDSKSQRRGVKKFGGESVRAGNILIRQVGSSFPGGRMEAGETPVETALREAWEEVALDPSLVTVVG